MKTRMLGLVLFCLMLIQGCAYCETWNNNSLGFAAGIATNYIKWAEIYSVSEFNSELYISDDISSNDEKDMFVDDLGIIYDNSNLEARLVTLFYISQSTSSLDMVNEWKRAASLFGAMIYGDPWKFDDSDIKNIKEKIDDVLDELNDAMYKFQDVLLNGGRMSFHQSGNLYFYLQYISDEKQWLITVE